MWLELAQAGLKAAFAYGSASVGKAQAAANTRISTAQAENDREIRSAGNVFSAARGALSRYTQSLQNNQTLAAGGEMLEANLVNARRREDSMAVARFDEQIRNAEQIGAQSAAAAFAGVGGEVADMISVSTRLMQQRAEREALTFAGYRTYDDARRAGAIAAQTVRSLDNSLILDSLDYTVTPAMQFASPSVWGSTIAAGLSSAVQSGLFRNIGGEKQTFRPKVDTTYDSWRFND